MTLLRQKTISISLINAKAAFHLIVNKKIKVKTYSLFIMKCIFLVTASVTVVISHRLLLTKMSSQQKNKPNTYSIASYVILFCYNNNNNVSLSFKR